MLAVLAGLSLALVAPLAAEGTRVSIPFRYGWRFHYGPGPDDGECVCVCVCATDKFICDLAACGQRLYASHLHVMSRAHDSCGAT